MSSVSSGRISVTVDRGTAHGVASGPHRLRFAREPFQMGGARPIWKAGRHSELRWQESAAMLRIGNTIRTRLRLWTSIWKGEAA